jgi:hypothetical protein
MINSEILKLFKNGITGYGASVMTSFGREISFEYVMCLNHTINLAVIDVLLPKKSKMPLRPRNIRRS